MQTPDMTIRQFKETHKPQSPVYIDITHYLNGIFNYKLNMIDPIVFSIYTNIIDPIVACCRDQDIDFEWFYRVRDALSGELIDAVTDLGGETLTRELYKRFIELMEMQWSSMRGTPAVVRLVSPDDVLRIDELFLTLRKAYWSE